MKPSLILVKGINNMNYSLLRSKKFRVAVLAALSGILSFISGKFGLGLNVEEITALVSAIIMPFLIYIGAEGFSEAPAKKVIEENKARKEEENKTTETTNENEN